MVTGNVAEIHSDKAGDTAYRGEAMKVRDALATAVLGLVLASCTSTAESATPPATISPAVVATTTSTVVATKTVTLGATPRSANPLVMYSCDHDGPLKTCGPEPLKTIWTYKLTVPVGTTVRVIVQGGECWISDESDRMIFTGGAGRGVRDCSFVVA